MYGTMQLSLSRSLLGERYGHYAFVKSSFMLNIRTIKPFLGMKEYTNYFEGV